MATAPALSQLPVDIRLNLMELSNTPKDLLSMISASPAFLNPFTTHRCSVTRAVINTLRQRLNDELVPITIIAVMTRRIHNRYRRKGSSEVERRLAPVVKSIKEGPGSVAWPTSLRILCEISDFICEIDEFVFEYAASAWLKLQEVLVYGTALHECWVSGKFRPHRLDLSKEEMFRHREAVIHFEAHRTLFFHEGFRLFRDEHDVHSMMLHSLAPRQPNQQAKPVYPQMDIIFDYMRSQHGMILEAVVRSFGYEECGLLPCRANYLHRVGKKNIPSGENEVAAFFNAHGNASTKAARYAQSCILQYRNPVDEQRYIHFLCAQGIQPLVRLRRMSAPGQQAFTLEKFAHLVASNRYDTEDQPWAVRLVESDTLFILPRPGGQSTHLLDELDHGFFDADRVSRFRALVRRLCET